MLWVPGGLLPAPLSLCPQSVQAVGWPGLERLTAGCGRSVVWMLEALEGLPESERAKYLDVTGQCRGGWHQTPPPRPRLGSNAVAELSVCVWGEQRGGSPPHKVGGWWGQGGG